MQEYKKTMIGKDQIVPIAERMRKNEVWLTMIHAFVTKEGQIEVCYDYQVEPNGRDRPALDRRYL